MKELKEKIRNCDLTKFKNYDEYIKYCQELVIGWMKENKDLDINEIKSLLEEVER